MNENPFNIGCKNVLFIAGLMGGLAFVGVTLVSEQFGGPGNTAQDSLCGAGTLVLILGILASIAMFSLWRSK